MPDARTGRPEPPRRTTGQALAEFALALPLFLLLFVTVFDFGRMMLIHATAVTASREGARYGAVVGDDPDAPQYADCSGIRAAVRRASGSLVTLGDDQIEIRYVEGATDSATTAACDEGLGPVASEIDSLDRVVVEVTVPYQAIVPLVHAIVGPITVVSEDRRSIAIPEPSPGP